MSKRDIITFRPDEELKDGLKAVSDLYPDRTAAIADLIKRGIRARRL